MKYKAGDKVVLTNDVDKLESLGIKKNDAKVMAGREYTIQHIDYGEFDEAPIKIDTILDVGSEYYINEECKAYLFSYWLNNCYARERVVIIAASHKEANKKFYKWICGVEFKEIKVICEELEVLS